MDRAYIDYAQFQRLTDEGICYVTKMKSNLKYKVHLHFFYGDSINAIQIQTWIVLIANLLCTIISRKIKRKVSFSQIVTMIRLTLMYYTDFISFMENPESDEMKILAERVNSPPQFPTLFD